MEDLPKLLPLWHDQSALKELKQHKKHYLIADRLPDQGGIGLDISLKKEEIQNSSLKYGGHQVTFGAEICALPFMPPNKGMHILDSKQQSSFNDKCREFCKKLEATRTAARRNPCYRGKLLLAHKQVNSLVSSKKHGEIDVPKRIVELANIFQKSLKYPKEELNCVSDCLALSKTADKVLLHPCGKYFNKLAFTVLEEANETPLRSFQIVKSHSVKLKKECIEQIKVTVDNYCYLKQNKQCYFVDYSDLSNVSVKRCLKNENVAYIVASPYIPVELISVLDDGHIGLTDVENGKILWSITKPLYADRYISGKFSSCDFGSYPRSVLILDNKELQSFDLRSEHQKPVIIFSTSHPSNCSGEVFSSVKNFVVNPFQHLLASNHHLYICDERYPVKPVMIWDHSLKDSPSYCDIATYNSFPHSSDAIILLATHKTQEMVSFNVRNSPSKVNPVSLSAPLLLSSITDWAHALRLQCANVHPCITQRLSQPIIGACAVPRSDSGFTAFQLTAYGDLFYQDFNKNVRLDAEKTYRTDTGCVLLPPEKIWPQVQKWTEKVCKGENRGVTPVLNLDRVHVDLRILSGALEKVSSKCSLCNSFKDVSSIDYNFYCTECPSCGLDELQCKKLIKAFEEVDVVESPSNTPKLAKFDVSYLNQFSDEYSKKLLDPWIEEKICVKMEYDPDNSFVSSVSTLTKKSIPTVPTKIEVVDVSLRSDDAEWAYSRDISVGASFMDQTQSFMSNQDYESQDVIPPSQDIRPVVGETIRTSKPAKIYQAKKSFQSAGF